MADFSQNVTAVMLVDKNKRVSLHWVSTKKIQTYFPINREVKSFTSHCHGSGGNFWKTTNRKSHLQQEAQKCDRF